MVLDYFDIVVLVCSLFLVFAVAIKIYYLLRSKAMVEHSMLCIAIVPITIFSIICSLYSVRTLFHEAETSLYILVFLLASLLVCCLQLLSHTIRKLNNNTDNDNLVTDCLTGAYSRHYIEDRLEAEVARYKRYNAPLSVITINISNFHRYNTIYGFQAGDRLLASVTSVIKRSLRETDFVARYEADQFVVVLTNTPEAGTKAVLSRLQTSLYGHLARNVEKNESSVMLNVKFGKAWCGLATRSGKDIITSALDQIQIEKSVLNKQHTVGLKYDYNKTEEDNSTPEQMFS